MDGRCVKSPALPPIQSAASYCEASGSVSRRGMSALGISCRWATGIAGIPFPGRTVRRRRAYIYTMGPRRPSPSRNREQANDTIGRTGNRGTFRSFRAALAARGRGGGAVRRVAADVARVGLGRADSAADAHLPFDALARRRTARLGGGRLSRPKSVAGRAGMTRPPRAFRTGNPRPRAAPWLEFSARRATLALLGFEGSLPR